MLLTLPTTNDDISIKAPIYVSTAAAAAPIQFGLVDIHPYIIRDHKAGQTEEQWLAVADKAVHLFVHTYLLEWDINMVYVANIQLLVCGVTSYLLLSHFLRSLIGGPRGYMDGMVVAWMTL